MGTTFPRARRWAALLLLAALPGCGSRRYPVTGSVNFDDGKPLEPGNLICERVIGGKTVMARGTILADGTFVLGTQRPGDGVLPGRYRVLVSPRGLSEAELA